MLYAADEAVAAHMGMRSKTVWHYWLAAYDPAFAKYSSGTILLLDMAKRAPSLGISTIDLGKGGEPYKQRLMNGAIPIAEGVVFVSPVLQAIRKLRFDLRALLRRSPLDGLVKKTGKILGRVDASRKFR